MAQNFFGKTDNRGSTPVTYNFTPLSSAEAFVTTKPYTVGEYCFYEGVLYRCKTDKAAGAWAPTKFEEANLGEHLTDAEKALLTKAEIDGYYDGMTVGNAEQIVGTVFEEDDTAYNYRTTGGSAEVGDRAYVDAITGASLPWNQLASTSNVTTPQTSNGITFTANSDGSWDITGTATGRVQSPTNIINRFMMYSGHKYLISLSKSLGPFFFRFASGVSSTNLTDSTVVNCTGDTNAYVSFDSGVAITDTVNITKLFANVYDLTAMFGSTIADYIYGLETAHAGDGVAWFRKYFPKPYYAYHAVGMEHVNAAAAKTVGFNQWDEEFIAWAPLGEYANNSGSKNYIPCKPNTEYHIDTGDYGLGYGVRLAFYDEDKNLVSNPLIYGGSNGNFTTPSNCAYMKFGLQSQIYGDVYKHDINISIRWDNSRDGDYEPYNLHTYPLADITLRGIPKIDESGNLYFDGDRYKPDGSVERRYGIVDLGTLTWNYSQESFNEFSAALSGIALNNAMNPLMICSKYTTAVWHPQSSADKVIYKPNNAYLYVMDSSYTDAATFKTAMSGVYLVYELATPTTEEADPYQYPMVVDNWGTEEFVDGLVESGDRDVAIPVGHETKYPPNLKDKLESAANNPDADGVYVLTHDGGSNTYTPLASNATIQNIIARLEALEGGGDNE